FKHMLQNQGTEPNATIPISEYLRREGATVFLSPWSMFKNTLAFMIQNHGEEPDATVPLSIISARGRCFSAVVSRPVFMLQKKTTELIVMAPRKC
ncbi:hypothetical protein SK128_008063, partial [Halocaridina rubra]